MDDILNLLHFFAISFFEKKVAQVLLQKMKITRCFGKPGYHHNICVMIVGIRWISQREGEAHAEVLPLIYPPTPQIVLR